MTRRALPLLVAAALLLPGPLASLESPVITVTTAQTVHLPGDPVRLIVSLSNPGPPVRADVFVGVISPTGEVRLVDASLALGPAGSADVGTFAAARANVLLPTGPVFPRPSDIAVDTNGDGLPDAAAVSASTAGWVPGTYRAFAALVEPGSAPTGAPRLLGSLSVAFFEVKAGGAASTSGAVAIAADGSRLFVANPDSGSVSAADTVAEVKAGEAPVGEDPRAVALGPEGRRLYVTSQGSSTLSVLDAGTLAPLATVSVGAEPYGVVADPRGHLVYVASAATDAVEVVDVRLARVIARIPVGPKPKGLAITADGSRLYATHFLSGQISVIDPVNRALLQVIPTGADSNMAQKMGIHPRDGRAYLPHIRSNVTNRAVLFDTTVFPVVSVIDLAGNQPRPDERIDLAVTDQPVNLPFDVGFSTDGRRLYVVNMGSGDVSVIDLFLRMRVARVEVGDGPRGIAMSPDGRRAYVANSLSDDVSVIDLGTHTEVKRIPVTTSPLAPQIKRGKLLFFSSRSTEISRERWMSCASCHFEGEHDGRVWILLPRGPRTTTSLRGAGETRPFHWSADRDEVQDFELTIRQLQAGSGLLRDDVPNDPLGPANAGRSADLDALAAFVESLRPKPSPFLNADGSLTAAALRGQAIFERSDVGCLECHPPPRYTDSTMAASPFIRHDVGTGGGPDEGFGPAVDTPSLRQVWNRTVFLHDGRAATLQDVLTTHNPGDRHARTSHLSPGEIDDVLAFLRSL